MGPSPKIHIPDPCRTTHVAEDIDGMPLYALSLILCFNSQPSKTCIWQNISSHITATDYWRKRERLFPDQLFNGRLLPQLSSNHCHKRTDSTYKTFHNCQTCSGFKLNSTYMWRKFILECTNGECYLNFSHGDVALGLIWWLDSIFDKTSLSDLSDLWWHLLWNDSSRFWRWWPLSSPFSQKHLWVGFILQMLK